MTPGQQQEIERLARENRVIEAITLYREATGASLMDAKAAIEQMQGGGAAPAVVTPRLADHSAVMHLLQTKGKIAAIKLYRDQTPGCGLKEAKEAVEKLAVERGVRGPSGGCMSMVVICLAVAGVLWWLR
jgi:ribosomal protein L7/L12